MQMKQIDIRTVIKISLVLLIGTLFLIAFPRNISAQVVINEVFPDPIETGELNEFIELFNVGSSPMDLTGWKVSDTKGATKTYMIPSGIIDPSGYVSLRRSVTGITLNNDGDGVVLKNASDTVIDFVSFNSVTEGLSLSRIPNGTGDFVLDTETSELSENIPLEIVIPTIVPTPTQGLAPYKAMYKINSPKDGNGVTLSSVQIYVDGAYTHHEDDEILQFYNGHECYTGVECGLGTHTISLRKSGYLSWEDTRDFTAGVNFEVNPVLNKQDLSTPTPTPKISPSPTPAKTTKPTPTSTPVQTDTSASGSAVLGIQENSFKTPEPAPENFENNKNKTPILPFILMFAGLCFIAVPIFSIIRNGKKDIEVS